MACLFSSNFELLTLPSTAWLLAHLRANTAWSSWLQLLRFLLNLIIASADTQYSPLCLSVIVILMGWVFQFDWIKYSFFPPRELRNICLLKLLLCCRCFKCIVLFSKLLVMTCCNMSCQSWFIRALIYILLLSCTGTHVSLFSWRVSNKRCRRLRSQIQKMSHFRDGI